MLFLFFLGSTIAKLSEVPGWILAIFVFFRVHYRKIVRGTGRDKNKRTANYVVRRCGIPWGASFPLQVSNTYPLRGNSPPGARLPPKIASFSIVGGCGGSGIRTQIGLTQYLVCGGLLKSWPILGECRTRPPVGASFAPTGGQFHLVRGRYRWFIIIARQEPQ